MKNLSQVLKKKNLIQRQFSSRSSLKNFLQKIDLINSVVLVKGSRGMQMEEFVETIKQKSEK